MLVNELLYNIYWGLSRFLLILRREQLQGVVDTCLLYTSVGTAVRQGCKSVVQLEMMKKLPDKRAENNPWPQWARVCKTDYGQEEAAAVFGHDPRIYETTVKEIISDENGQISAVKTVKLEAKKDESGRSVMSEIEGSESVIPCELLLIAAGFVGCESYISDAFGIEKTPRGCLTTDSGKYSTACLLYTSRCV